jgi:succinate dehydrogenase hydrophobic anchor subunit
MSDKMIEALQAIVTTLLVLYFLVVMYPHMKEGMRELVQDVRTVHSD